MRLGVTSSSLTTPRTLLSCCFWYNNSSGPGCCITLWSHIKKPDCKWKNFLVSFTEPHSCSNHRLQAKHFSSSSALLSFSSHVREERSQCRNINCRERLPRACTKLLCLCGCEWKHVITYTVSRQRWDFAEILLSFSMPLKLKVCSPVANLITCSSKSHDSAHGNESHLLWRTAMNSKHSPVTPRPGDDLYLLLHPNKVRNRKLG